MLWVLPDTFPCQPVLHGSVSMGEFSLAPMSDTAVMEPVDMALGLYGMCFVRVTPWLWLLLPGVKPSELNIPNILFLDVGLGCVLACYALSSNPMPSVCWDTGDNFSRDGADLKPTGDNPAETFQGLWDGLSTSRRLAFGCGQCLDSSLEPQNICGGAAVGA